MMGIKLKGQAEKYKIAVMAILLATACFLTYYFHAVVKAEVVFTHFFYIPIILASFWWKRKGLCVAIFLAVVLILSHTFLRPDVAVVDDYFRALLFIVIAVVVAILSERITKSEEATKLAHSELQQIFNTAADGMCVIDKGFNVLRVNEAFLTLSGIKEDGALGKKCYEVLRGSLCRTPDCPLTRILGGEERVECEIEKEGKDGTRITCIVTATPFLGAGDKLIGIVEDFKDITERKQAEERLRESEEKYRSLVNNVKLGVFRSMPEPCGRFLEVNLAMEEITGYSREELLQMEVCDLYVYPEEREVILEEIASAEGKATRELSFRKKDGTEIVVSDIKVVVRDDAGKILHFDGIIEDITERKQAEETLRESRDYLERLTNSMWDAVFEVKMPERVIEWANDSFKLIGYDPGEYIGKTTEFLYLDESEFLDFGNKLKNVIAAGKDILHAEQLLKRKSGEVFPAEITATISKEKGEIVRVTSIVRDITERKQAEEREKQLQQELYQSSRLASIGELAAGVAHEINNPLTAVVGFSQLLLDKTTDEDIKRSLERIHNEGWRAAKVVENLLTFARRRQSEKQPQDINDVLQKALELRAYELRTGGIEVTLDLAPGLPMAVVDFHQIQEVFLNIILNAEQAMLEANKRGKLSIKSEETKGCIRVMFTDDGPGITAEHLDKLFDPFFTTREERGGTGLGLSICHGIVSEHGGKIQVIGKPGKGTTFFVELPAIAVGSNQINSRFQEGQCI